MKVGLFGRFAVLILVSTFAIKMCKAATCHCKFQAIDEHHSACLDPVDEVKDSGVSAEEQVEIIDEHNRARSAVDPQAADMQIMVWDDEVAEVAQGWANQCDISHDGVEARRIPGRFHTGQNYYYNTVKQSWTTAIRSWEDEKEDFEYGGGNTLDEVSHYTQIVWANSVRVGCGWAKCSSFSLFVCNYGPAGNVGNISFPYISGTPCTGCGGQCDNNTCDCQELSCENYGSKVNGSCACDCYRNHHVGESCALNCTIAADPGYCDGNGYKCTSFNVPALCPWKCKDCPYGGLGYICEKEASTLESTSVTTGQTSVTTGGTTRATTISTTPSDGTTYPASGKLFHLAALAIYMSYY